MDAVTTVGERMRGAKREERFVGTNDQPNYFRRPYGRGWALVGDAGYQRDFITGLGIMDAFRDAQLLADAIDNGFAERRPLDEAMAAYEQRRNELAKPLYDITCDMASGETLEPAKFMAFGAALQAMMAEATKGVPA